MTTQTMAVTDDAIEKQIRDGIDYALSVLAETRDARFDLAIHGVPLWRFQAGQGFTDIVVWTPDDRDAYLSAKKTYGPLRLTCFSVPLKTGEVA